MSDHNVSERRIRQVQEAVTSGNWKQALQVCDKWQKKGEKSDRFLALKASILLNQQDGLHREKGKTETLQLCRRSVPVTDIEAIYQLQDSLKRIALYKEEGPKLWERATATLPNDKEFLTTWLNSSLAENNWLVAQKAAMALRKAFPKERQYEFLNILLCYLIHKDAGLSEKERMLFGTLAYRMISKAAESVPNDKSQLLAPGKAISTTEELALLTKIYTSTGHEDEAISLLQGEYLGLSSRVAEQDPQMVFSLLIEALDRSNQYDVVFETCQKLLTADGTQSKAYVEDDRIWRTIGQVARANDARLLGSCLGLVETVLQKHPNCREVYLAKLELLTHAARMTDDKKDNLLTSCRQYLEIFGSKPFCFGDTVAPLKACEINHVQEIIRNSDGEDATEAQMVLGLKLDYSTLTISGANELDFLRFATKALKLHKSLPKQKTDCPEAALLAALALIRLAAKSQDSAFLLQACYILENNYVKYTEYYPSAVRLVQLHRALGLMSLAMEKFGALSVKNIQWETVGHLVLTRISSLHPLQCDAAQSSFSPLGAFDAGLNMLMNAERSLEQQIKKGLEYGSYSNVLDSVMVKHDIEVSLNRQIFNVEERKIQALIGMSVDTVLDGRPHKMIDRRDFAFLEKYDVNDGALDAILGCGPLPQDSWLDVMAMWDHIAVIVRSEIAGGTNQTDQAISVLSKSLKSANEISTHELTDAEASSHQCYKAIAGILVAHGQSIKDQPMDVDKHIRDIVTWLKSDGTDGIKVINNTITLLLTFLLRKAKSKANKGLAVSKERITELERGVIDAEETIHQWTKDLKTGINASGVLGKLIEVVGGRVEDSDISRSSEYKNLAEELAETYDELALEEYCGKMKDSWEEALDGIMAIKIKMPK